MDSLEAAKKYVRAELLCFLALIFCLCIASRYYDAIPFYIVAGYAGYGLYPILDKYKSLRRIKSITPRFVEVKTDTKVLESLFDENGSLVVPEDKLIEFIKENKKNKEN